MSNIQEIKKRNERLMNLLEKMAYQDCYGVISDKKLFDEYYNELCEIYKKLPDGKEYRHMYSQIFQKLHFLSIEDDALNENLSGNLALLYDLVAKKAEKTKNDELLKYVEKLYDHVTLDIQRLSSQKFTNIKMGDSPNESYAVLKDVKKEQSKLRHDVIVIGNTMKNIEPYVDKMDKAQIEVITVLSIFTSIVLSFVGGMAFSTSVLENIHKTDIYRLLFVMIILGLVLVNVIWGLLAIIKYINKNIEACSKPFKTINAILIALLILNGFAYGLDIFEAENKMNQQLNSGTSEAVSITNSNVNNKDKAIEEKTEETEETEETESTKKSKEKTDTKTTKK